MEKLFFTSSLNCVKSLYVTLNTVNTQMWVRSASYGIDCYLYSRNDFDTAKC